MKTLKNISAGLIPLFFISSIFAQTETVQIQNHVNQLTLTPTGNFTQLDFQSDYTVVKNLKPGHPELPVIQYNIIIPENLSIQSIEVLNFSVQELSGSHTVYPAQKLVTTNEQKTFTQPDAQIYQDNRKYPSSIIEHVHTGNFNGHRIASFLVYPVRYNPVAHKLYFYDEINFKIHYKLNTQPVVKPERLFKEDLQRIDRTVRKMVANPEDVFQYQPMVEEATISSGVTATPAPSQQGIGVRYLVITTDALDNAFEPLVEWKNKTGVSAEVRTLEWIKANTIPGVDDAETIRNFIKWAYQKWGTQYVLLGGDTDVIPTRFVFTNDVITATDLYFSDLDGAWNYDGDSQFGEVEDSLDYYPEIYVSRFPVRNTTEVTNLVNKTLKYLKAQNMPTDYGRSLLTIAPNLWQSGDGSIICNFVTDSVPEYINQTRLEEGGIPGTSPQTVIDYLNQGFNFIYTPVHGMFNVIATENGGSLVTYDMDNLTNGNLSVWLLSSCSTNDIAQNSFSEHFMNNDTSGGVGFIGSTSRDYPYGMMFSNQHLLTSLYDNSITELSPANLLSKLDYIPWYSLWDSPMRQLYLTYLTLGDPQLNLWTNTIATMSANISGEIYLGQNNITVALQSRGGELNDDATVCIYKENDVWEVKNTTNGEADFDFEVHAPGTIYITLTSQNLKPIELNYSAETADASHLRISDKDLSEDDNSNGKVESGETVSYQLQIENNGSAGAEGIYITITCEDNFIDIIQGDFELESIDAEDKIWLDGELQFSVDTSIPIDTTAHFEITLRYNEEMIDTDNFDIPVYSPQLIITENNLIEIYDFLYEFYLQLGNTGSGTSTALQATLTSNDPDVYEIDPSSVNFSALDPSESAWGSQDFEILLNNPDWENLDFHLEITDNHEKVWEYDIYIPRYQTALPESLSFMPKSESTIYLYWKYDNACEKTRYNIYRSPHEAGNFTKINSLPIVNNCYYVDMNISTGQIYDYKIQAVDSSGNTKMSTEILSAWGSVPNIFGYPLFSNEYRVGLSGDAVPFDFNGNGSLEIAAPGNNGQLIIYSPQGSPIYHQFSGLDGQLLTPAFGNVDNDASPEMLVPVFNNGSTGNKIYVFDCISLELQQTLTEPDSFTLNDIALADKDEDGILEIFATGFGGNLPEGDPNKNKSKLFAWEFNGRALELYASTVFNNTYHLLNAPAIHDLNNDQVPEIVLGFPDGKVKIFSSTDLTEIDEYDCGNSFIGCQISIADLDNNGFYDLAFTTNTNDKRLIVLEYDYEGEELSLKWETATDSIIHFYGFTPSPTIGNLDQDEALEIALPTEHLIYIFNHDGSLLNPWPRKWDSGWIESYPKAGISHAILGDINGDESCDLIVASSQGYLYAFDISTGDWIKGFPMPLKFQRETSPCLADLDNDNDMEIVFQEFSGWLYVADITSGYEEFQVEWPMRYANHQHTGVYPPQANKMQFTSSSPLQPQSAPKIFTLSSNYPNPFNPTTIIKYQIPEAAHVRLEIFNILGQKIKTLVNQKQRSDFYKIEWDGRNDSGKPVGSGLYFYHIEAESFKATKKMLLLR